MKAITKLALVVPLVASSACAFQARDADGYRQVTRELVETRGSAIEDCYDVALQTDSELSGDVVVNFTVEKKTGKIINLAVDKTQSTATPELEQCVLTAIEGLQLTPADARDGIATFSWHFQPGEPMPNG